ncbi:MAG: 30S ribosomal protein S8 [Firmicutes bacterium]|nr:30S ribosomal protein S8 [Bacillota bacterium]
MVMTDPIADMLTRIRNASSVKHESVDIPSSKLKGELARVLKDEGFIREYKVIEDKKQGMIRVYLKYDSEKGPVIQGLKRISKPGLRVYANKDEIPRVLGGLGVAVLSTSQGIMTDRRARKEGIGGEVICYVW